MDFGKGFYVIDVARTACACIWVFGRQERTRSKPNVQNLFPALHRQFRRRVAFDLQIVVAVMEPLSEELKEKIMEAFHESRKQAFDAIGLDVQKLFEKALDLIRVNKVTK